VIHLFLVKFAQVPLDLWQNYVFLEPIVLFFVLFIKVGELLAVFDVSLVVFLSLELGLKNFLLNFFDLLLLLFQLELPFLVDFLLQNQGVIFLLFEERFSFKPFLFLSSLVCLDGKCCLLGLFLLLLLMELLQLLFIHLS
jgi:hypothetical protein